MNRILPLALLALTLIFAPSVGHAQTAQNWVKTELFFGLSRPNRPPISSREWENFAAKRITPRFPDGFTVLDGVGQWRGKNGKIGREKTKILLVVHPKTAHFERAITKIIGEYKNRFAQESVLRVESKVKVAF